MEEEFLKEYFENELYLQNPPLIMKKFIEQCKKFNIYLIQDELELYEKLGIFKPIFRIKYQKDKLFDDFRYFEFSKEGKHELLNALHKNQIFIPNDDNFIAYSDFKNEDYLIENYYSIFQIEHIYKIRTKFVIQKNILFNYDKKNFEMWKNEYVSFFQKKFSSYKKKLYFLLNISRLYYPPSKHDFKIFIINPSDNTWFEDKNKFRVTKILEKYGYNYEDIISFIREFFIRYEELTGTKNNRKEWILFYEYLNIDYKLNLEKNAGLGYYYLSLIWMLKSFLDDYSKETRKKININIFSIHRDDENKYDSLFYLSNKLKLNYQPSIILFVEGKSEVKMFKKLFKWRLGYYPEECGIDIISFDGVTKLFSTYDDSKKLKELIIQIRKNTYGKNLGLNNEEYDNLNEIINNLEKLDILISNWSSFISYNLSKWYIIPFFVSDDEGKVWNFLNNEKIIHFQGKKYDFPEEWYYVWGKSNNYVPFNGNDIELANFSDLEISNVLNKLINEDISVSNITALRNKNKSINQVQNSKFKKEIKRKKVEIIVKLTENLIKEFEKNHDETIFNRPIFVLLNKINELNFHKNNPTNKEDKELFDKTIINILEGCR